MNSQFFKKRLELMQRAGYENVIEMPTYLVVGSPYKEAWYNFIIPTVACSNLNWDEVENFTQAQRQTGKEYALYIQNGQFEDFKLDLKKYGYKNIGNDTYQLIRFGNSARLINEASEVWDS